MLSLNCVFRQCITMQNISCASIDAFGNWNRDNIYPSNTWEHSHVTSKKVVYLYIVQDTYSYAAWKEEYFWSVLFVAFQICDCMKRNDQRNFCLITFCILAFVNLLLLCGFEFFNLVLSFKQLYFIGIIFQIWSHEKSKGSWVAGNAITSEYGIVG